MTCNKWQRETPKKWSRRQVFSSRDLPEDSHYIAEVTFLKNMKAIQKLGGNKSRMWYKFAIPFLCPNSTAFSSLMLAECEGKSWEERIGGGVKRRKGVGGREAFLGSGSDLLFLRPSSSLPSPSIHSCISFLEFGRVFLYSSWEKSLKKPFLNVLSLSFLSETFSGTYLPPYYP